MQIYTIGDTIWLKATFRDEDDALIDPSTPWGRVFDSSSTVVMSPSPMTKVSTGVYKVAWQTNIGSVGEGVCAFEANGINATKVYKRREILFKLA